MESNDLLLAIIYIFGLAWSLVIVHSAEESLLVKILAVILWPIAITIAFICSLLSLLLEK